jgi:DMSO/TMAO reductase YedYZ molybdopterin-dependent catalytic subunit
VRGRGDDVTRRTFLRLAAAGLSSAFGPLGQLGCTQKLTQQRPSAIAPFPSTPFTPTDDWYVVSIVDAYHADLERYRLKIGGIVDQGLSLSVPALRTRFENVIEPITLACVANPPQGGLRSAGFFRGVRVKDVLDAASISDRAEAAIITGLDGYVALPSIKELLRPESIFAFDMGPSPSTLAPLTVEHGFPLRIMTPGLYGYMQPKWIDTVTIADQRGYEEVLRGSIEWGSPRYSATRSATDAPSRRWTFASTAVRGSPRRWSSIRPSTIYLRSCGCSGRSTGMPYAVTAPSNPVQPTRMGRRSFRSDAFRTPAARSRVSPSP